MSSSMGLGYRGLGYSEGQQDAIAWLRGLPGEDERMAPLTYSARLAAALWSLGHNLAVAAALSAAAYRGHDAGWSSTGEGHNAEYTRDGFTEQLYLDQREEDLREDLP